MKLQPPFPLKALAVLLAAVFASISASAQSPYAGDYFGRLFINDTGGGPVFITIDEAGALTANSGELAGSVDNAGTISFDANDFGFSTSSIDGNFSFTATGTANTLNYRLEADKGPGVFSSDSLDEVFTQTNPLNFFAGATDMLWDGTRFVALTNQSIAISTDGQNWETRSIGITAEYKRIAFGNGVYVIVGNANTVATSPDLVTWTQRSSGIPGLAQQNFADVAFFNGRFRAVNIVKNYISSTDGVSWTQEDPFVTGGFGGAGRLEVLNGALFAAYSNPSGAPQTVYYRSTNGTTFTGPSTGVAIGNSPLAFAFGNGTYLASSQGGMARSTDGTTWTKVDGLPSTTPRAIAFSGGQFSANFLNDRFYTSADGLTWTEAPGATGDAHAMANNGATVSAVGDEPFASPDSGSNWARTSSNGLGGDLDYEVVAGNGVFLFQTQFGNTYRSTDGETFADTGFQFDAIGYGNGIFAGYDRIAQVLRYSVDGLTWYAANIIPDTIVGFGQTLFNGEVFYKNGLISEDGINWDWAEGRTTVAGNMDRGGGGEIIDYGNGPSYTISLDNGSTFLGQNNSNRQAFAADYGNGIWSLGFSSGHYAYGPSLVSLTGGRYQEGVETPNITSINFLGGIFYGSIEDNRVIVSTDGSSWVPKNLSANVKLIGAAQSGPLGVITGEDAAVFTVDLGGSFALPGITSQPSGVPADEADDVTLTAVVSNADGAVFKWIRDGVPVDDINISGADSPVLSIAGIRADQAGDYRLIVIGPDGGTISDVATVSVAPLAVFTTHPQSATVSEGGNITFNAATDDAGATFQWKKNGADLPGETGSSLTLTGVGAVDAAIYTVVATNAVGPRESLPAALSVSSGGGASLRTDFMANVPVFDATRDAMYSFAQQGDQLIVGGTFSLSQFPRRSNLMRLNADGTRDSSFGSHQIETGNNYLAAAVDTLGFDSQGRLYVGGSYQFPDSIMVTDSNGAELVNQNITIAQSESVYGFFPFGNTMTFAGNFTRIDGFTTNSRIGRVDTGGANPVLNTTYISNTGQSTASMRGGTAAAMQSDGKLLIGGQVSPFATPKVVTIRRYNTDGTVDSTFSEPLFASAGFVGAMTLDDEDNIYVIGSSTTVNGSTPASTKFFKFSKNGTPDLNFANGVTEGPGGYQDFAYVGEQTLVAAGFGGLIALSAADGSPAAFDFGTGPKRADQTADGNIYGIQRTTDGFIIGGFFSFFDGAPTNGIAWYEFGTGSSGPPAAIAVQPTSVSERLGQPARFAVAATGSGLRYEWTRNGVLIEGETSNQLHFSALEPGDAGTYQVSVFDAEDNSVESARVDLTIPDAAPPETSFEEWAAVNLPPGSEFTVDGDLNGNGQADGLDFIFGSGARPSETQPTTSFQTGSQLGIGGDEVYLTFSVRRRIGAAGLNVSPVASTNLNDLASGASNVVPMGSEMDGDFEILHYRTTFSMDDSGRGFFQIILIEE